MKSLRKVITMVLAVCILYSLAACGSTKTNEAQTSTASGSEASANSSTNASSGEFEYQKIIDYPETAAIKDQAPLDKLAYKQGKVPVIAFMPAGTEFPYIMAVGEGVKDTAAKMGAKVITLATQSGSDINGQMGMIQDAISQKVDVILLNTHDDNAAAPLVKKAIEAGILVFNINSDSIDYPAPLHGVIGYTQKKGNIEQGKMLAEKYKDKKLIIGIIEGLPGYHNNERTGGFLEGIKDHPDFEVVSKLNGQWNTDGGNTAAMDMLQANPDINMIYAANDMEAMGAMKAIQALGKKDIILAANDGNTEFLEAIANGNDMSTLNTVPFQMGQVACQAAVDALYGKFKGGFAESPSYVTTKDNVLDFLREPEKLMPKPSKAY